MTRLAILAALLAALLSCAANRPSPDAAKIVAAEASHRADPRNVDLAAELMDLYFKNGRPEACIGLYEGNPTVFQTDPRMLCIYGAALCQRGGAQTDITETLYLVRRGMIVLDDAVARFPDSRVPYLYRGVTYSHFPAVMSARSASEDDLGLLFQGRDTGRWQLADGEIAVIYQAYLTIGQTYSDAALLRDKRAALEAEPLAVSEELRAAYDAAIAEVGKGSHP